ncbi:MAG: hypothetical protein ACOYVF_09455 [Candidatus Zixiibacteriota bacterium]
MFLIILISSVLFYVSFLVEFPLFVRVLLTGLPLVFYLFTFFDLFRSIRNRRRQTGKTFKTALIFVMLGLLYQVFAPNAAGNFIYKNFPDIFIMPDNSLSPLYVKGEYLKASRLTYSIDVIGLDERLVHSLPDRYDLVRFVESGKHRTGLVVGLPGEEIQIEDGVVLAYDRAIFEKVPAGLNLTGDWPLTSADSYSILIATLQLGKVVQVDKVNLHQVVGKVERLF